MTWRAATDKQWALIAGKGISQIDEEISSWNYLKYNESLTTDWNHNILNLIRFLFSLL